MKDQRATWWIGCCIAAAAASLPCETTVALEGLVTEFSFSVEGHCSGSRQGEVRRESNYNIAEIIIDEDKGQWLERVVTECYSLTKGQAMSPRKAYESFQAAEDARCPGLSRWSVLLDETHRLVFEQHIDACADEPARLLLGLAINGKEDRWLVTYSARQPVRDPDDRQSFLDSLMNVEILTQVTPTMGFPVWGPTVGPAWVGALMRDHIWSDRHDVMSQVPIPPDWSLTQRAYDQRMPLWGLFITPPGQGFDTSNEALVLTRIATSNWNVQRHLDTTREDLGKRCKGKANVEVLLQERDRLVLEAVAIGCKKVDYEYRLMACLQGGESIFEAEYVVRKAQDPASLREAWAPRMLAIRIDPIGTELPASAAAETAKEVTPPEPAD